MPVTFDDKAMARQLREGIANIDATYRRLGRELGEERYAKRILGRATTKVFRSMAAEARKATAVRTGQLRRTVRTWHHTERGGSVYDVRFGYWKPNRIFKALGSEFGNARYPNPPQALRKAWEAKSGEVLQRIQSELRQLVESLGADLAAKLARTRRGG